MSSLNLSAGKIARRIAEKGESGTVCGVFSQGIYCKVKNETLLFHDAKWGFVPFGIAVQDFAAFSVEAAANVDDIVVLSETKLVINRKCFDISISCDVPRGYEPNHDASKERISAIYEYVKEKGSKQGILEFIEANRVGCSDAIKGLVNGDTNSAVKLIGLGRGLTPSGDDFLCGFFAVLNALSIPAVSLREVVYDNLDRTTGISAAYLAAVIGSRYFTIYDRAVKAIFGTGDFKEDIDFVLSMGASSGTDTLIGALTAAGMTAK
ncbi:MAG: DUF2877 domain-containing protein [Clostridia bacterium]|nr:DUF2877 domain-containing protein [Clostridia bacterium]